MAFNIYEWRRNQLLTESSIHPDPKDLTTNPEADLKKQREQLFQRLLKDFENDPEAIAIIKKQMASINENSDSNEFKYGTYSKDEVTAKVGPGGQVRWGSKLVTVDELPDQVQFTKVISGIPTFLPVGKPKDMGDSNKSIDYQIKLDKEKGRTPNLD